MTDTIYKITHAKNDQTKIWKSDGNITPSVKSKYYDQCEVITVANIHELSEELMRLAHDRKSCLLRGSYIGDEKASKIDPQYREGKIRRITDIFRDQKLHSIMIDVDNYISENYDFRTDPEECIEEYITNKLPSCFHDITYHYQFSSSAGKRGSEHILKVHIWFYLSNAYSSRELKQWATDYDIDCDKMLFSPVQPHFTANPIFEYGVTDPIENRSGFIEGLAGDEVNLVIESNDLINTNETRQQIKNNAINNDPVAQFLTENGYLKSVGRDGQLNIVCPFKDEHSIESTETSTVYYPPYTGGFKGGAFDCKHQSCALRTKRDFLDKLGVEMINLLNPQNSSEIAQNLINDLYSLDNKSLLIRNRESWYLFNGKTFSERESEGI